ncbi:MAG: phosphomethylpyrimidine synthase [Desulfuromonas sp. SDB]|nr:MAG: phosphomethylpyrimidine synthase [Desulfuromonas sp. SDB]
MTQMKQAKHKIVTPAMEYVSRQEEVNAEIIREGIAEGRIVLPHNKNHKMKCPQAIGDGCSVKVNVNIGTSKDYDDFQEELDKAKTAFDYDTDAIMILSTWGDLRGMRRKIVEMSPVPVGSVPIYDAAVKAYQDKKRVIDFSEKDFIQMFKDHAEDGIDFMTIHVGVTKPVVEKIRKTKRILKVVSRGGAIVAGWMIKNNLENPFYSHFDEILSIAQEYDITLSLGDGMRPGAVADGTDDLQLEELFVMGELVERSRQAGVQVMVEGPGHLPIDQVEMNVKLAKKITENAPFFVLGPLVTDCAPGYDHIVSAIGGAIAAMHGTDFLCYVTPAEHVSLPTVEDVKQGLIVSKIAAQAVNASRAAKFKGKAFQREYKMALARKKFDWEEQAKYALDKGEKLKQYQQRRPYDQEGCSMCGPFCAIKIVEEITKG